MNDAKVLQGKWYLPDDPGEVYAGSFNYSREEGCYLEIVGSFEGFMPSSRRRQLVLGETLGKGKVTLVDCFRVSHKANMNGVSVSRYYATFALIGEHFIDISNIKFNKLRASIADLEDWVGIYGVDKLNINFTDKVIDLSYRSPEEQFFTIKGDLQVGFEFEYTFPVVSQIANVHITQRSFLNISSNSLISFRELINQFSILYRLLSLAYYDSPHIKSIELRNISTDTSQAGRMVNIELYYSDHFFNKKYKVGKEHYEFLFTYQQVRAEFPSIIKLWFSLYEKVSPTVNLFTDLLLKREYGLELKFLSAIQAVETFHRNLYGVTERSEEEHKNRIKLIFDGAPKELHKWLGEKLAFSNEPSLRKRLKDLYGRIPEEVTSKLIKDKKAFISGVVNSRNYYTHYNSALKNSIMSNQEISKTVEKLKIFIVCLILNELGLNKKQIIEFAQPAKIYPYAEI